MELHLKQVIKRKKITMKKMAIDLKIEYQTLSNYVRNIREPDIEILYRIAKYLNVSIEELITGKERTFSNVKEQEIKKHLKEIEELLQNEKDERN